MQVNNSNNTLLYIDTETTGLDNKKNDILVLSYMLEVGGMVIDEGEFKMKPFNSSNIEQAALDINGITREEIEYFDEPIYAKNKFVKALKKNIDFSDKENKLMFCGFNVMFDVDFLKEFFWKCNDRNFFNYFKPRTLIDPMYMLRYLNYIGKINLTSFNLADVCKYFNIEHKAHDATSDINATRQVLKLIEERFIK
jgi:DNA polymerase-3 subunit epsilon